MNFLLKRNQWQRCMATVTAPPGWWDELIANPPVMPDKSGAPLAIYGRCVADPDIDPGSGYPRCTGSNVDSIFALQLDFDSGMTIDSFMEANRALRYSLYTSYSYGVKEGDRFRVVVPLSRSMPCELLQNGRVRKNLLFHFRGVDQCCFDRGHWQILPVRNPAGKYEYIKHLGEPWNPDIETYKLWKKEDDEEFARRAMAARERAAEVDVARLVADLDYELREIPVGSGVRYAEAKRLLAKYMHKGLGDAVLGVECPWSDRKWTNGQWERMLRWAVTIV